MKIEKRARPSYEMYVSEEELEALYDLVGGQCGVCAWNGELRDSYKTLLGPMYNRMQEALNKQPEA